jgi:hypothetical protein
MKPSDPQFLYMILVLPSLFGLTLVGEGLSKIFKKEYKGWFPLVFGFVFIGIVIFSFFYFSGF